MACYIFDYYSSKNYNKSCIYRTKAKMGLSERRSAGSIEDTEEPIVSHTIEKSKKVLSTSKYIINILCFA